MYKRQLLGSLGLVNKTMRKARERGNKEVAGACLCYLVSWGGYLITISFLACGYRFTLPAMVSLGIALYFAGERELDGSLPVFAPEHYLARTGANALSPVR